jgi:tRNA (guanine-N7-)-methyltransferase
VVELIPDSYVARLDLPKIFGRYAPVHVDLGCGDGAFLFALAQRHPEKNFLGIERLSGRVEKASRKAAKIDNMRVLNVETSYAVRYLLPERSVETFYLLFPDPWPKRRHHRRRIVTPDFLNSIHSALEERGTLRIATDQLDYFRQIERLASDAAEERTLKLDCLEQSSSRFSVVDHDDDDLPVTKFERRFQAQGAPIYRLELRKVSPVK